MGWEKEFPAGAKPPRMILDMVAHGEVEDWSWHNDTMPSIGVHTTDERDEDELRLWSDYADPDEREAGGPRFTVTLGIDGITFFQGDDVAQAVATFRTIRHLFDPLHPLSMIPRTALIGSEEIFARAMLPLPVAMDLNERQKLPQLALRVPDAGYFLPVPKPTLALFQKGELLAPVFETPYFALIVVGVRSQR